LLSVVRGILRELSDQGAYERHLQSGSRVHCGAEWRAFIDRRLQRKYRQGKCC
jgi:hypothetical protein